MTTDREKYAAQEIAPVELNEGGAIVLETFSPDTGPHVSINFYDEEGGLGGYLSSISPRHRAQILALGRAIVEALDPEPAPPQEEPLDESARQRLAAWGSIAKHPFFTKAYYSGAPLIDAMLEQLDGLVDQPAAASPDDECCSTVDAVELVSDPALPLDVEIRTIALDAAVRIAVDTGNDVVTHARAIERFLVGEAEEAPRFSAVVTSESEHAVYDRVLDRVAPFGPDRRAHESVTRKVDEWNSLRGEPFSWSWTAAK